jgi:ABC-type glutathione transport system ATPase component
VTPLQKNNVKPILQVRNLSVYSKTRKCLVIDNCSFSVNKGDSVAVFGENGAGKSTVFKALLGLLRKSQWQVSGKLSVENHEVSLDCPNDFDLVRGKFFRCIFQEPALSLNPSLCVGSQLSNALSAVYPDTEEDALFNLGEAALYKAGLEHPHEFFKRYPCELSGGQQQRVGIGYGLCSPSSILLADELTNSLDSVSIIKLIQRLLKLKRTSIGAIIAITHDPDVIRAMKCNKILSIKDGKVQLLNGFSELPEPFKDLNNAPVSRKIANEILLQVDNAKVWYDTKGFFLSEKKLVLNDVSFKVHWGEYLAIVGNSGSGKSTVSKLVSGLIKKFQGEVYFDGKNIRKIRTGNLKYQFYQNFQMIFQDSADTFDPAISIRKNLRECFLGMGFKDSAIAGLFSYYSRLLGIKEKNIDKLPGDLSGGEKQLYALMRALAPNPSMLIADEAFTHLDNNAQNKLISYFISRKNSEHKPLTAIIVAHEIGMVLKLCSRIIVIDKGQIVDQGDPEYIINSKQETTRELVNAARLLGSL